MYSGAWEFVNPLEFSIFLHKYELKCGQIFTQILKLDKGNQILSQDCMLCSWCHLCRMPTPMEGSQNPEFPPFVDSFSSCGLMNIQVFRKASVAFSKFVLLYNASSEVMWELLCSRHSSPQSNFLKKNRFGFWTPLHLQSHHLISSADSITFWRTH